MSEREAFEKWITAPPYEKDISRNSNDPVKSCWPGQYRDYTVQVAWEAWKQTAEEETETVTDELRKAVLELLAIKKYDNNAKQGYNSSNLMMNVPKALLARLEALVK